MKVKLFPCSRGWAGKKPSICANTGYPAFVFGLPVFQAYRLQLSRIWAGRFCSCISLFGKWKWLSEINSENYKFSGFFPARYPVPAQPEPEFEIREQDIPFRYKYLVPAPLNPYLAVPTWVSPALSSPPLRGGRGLALHTSVEGWRGRGSGRGRRSQGRNWRGRIQELSGTDNYYN